jgi:hypothetical protein
MPVNNHTITHSDKDQKVKESVLIRGICSALQSMSLPTLENVNSLLSKFGYTIRKI